MKQLEREAVLHRLFTLFFICTALLWSTNCIAALGELGDAGGINDNPHNLSSQSTTPVGETDMKSTTSTEICVFCHTPHGATPSSTLWGRPDPTGPVGGFQTLTNPALGIDDPAIIATTKYGTSYDYPNGSSKLCLSCHDGVTAIGVLANGPEIEMTGTGKVTGTAIIDLTKSHPISFVYNSDVQLHLGSSYIWPTSAYLSTDSVGDTWVQCTICHQPHKDTKNASYSLPFWRGAGNDDVVEYNDVCQACHTSTPTRTEHAYP